MKEYQCKRYMLFYWKRFMPFWYIRSLLFMFLLWFDHKNLRSFTENIISINFYKPCSNKLWSRNNVWTHHARDVFLRITNINTQGAILHAYISNRIQNDIILNCLICMHLKFIFRLRFLPGVSIVTILMSFTLPWAVTKSYMQEVPWSFSSGLFHE